jgi:hypothetical protein
MLGNTRCFSRRERARDTNPLVHYDHRGGEPLRLGNLGRDVFAADRTRAPVSARRDQELLGMDVESAHGESMIDRGQLVKPS